MTANEQNFVIPVRKIASQLAVERSAERRSQVATVLGTAFAQDTLSESERSIAIKIFERLARDVATDVRRALAENIKSSPFLPRAIAQTLAQDIETVAIPVLRYSMALSEDDLLEIIADGSTAKQIAIAERECVDEPVTEALVDTGKREVVGTLLANSGAKVGEAAFHNVIDTFSDDRTIQALLVDRSKLPTTVTARLVGLISNDLRKRLVTRHGLPDVLAKEIVQQGNERALLQAIPPATSMREIETIVGRLHAKDALTPTLLLRALCVGKLDVFTAAIAALARIPIINARALMHDVRGKGFKELYKRSRLSKELEPAFRIALGIVLDVRRSTAFGWESADTKQVIERLVRTYDYLSPEGLESVLCQFGRQASNAPVSEDRTDGATPGSPYLDRPLRSYAQAAGEKSPHNAAA